MTVSLMPKARFVAVAFVFCGLLHILVNGPSLSRMNFSALIYNDEDPLALVMQNSATHAPFPRTSARYFAGTNNMSTVSERELRKREDFWDNTTWIFEPQNMSYPDCPATPPGLVGPIRVWQDAPTWEELEKLYSPIDRGGHGKPKDCVSNHRMALVIPYRDREEHLRILLHNMHSLLKKQQIDYTIIVVEQIENQTFNRAKLMNVGFKEAMKLYPWECFIFHDVDLLPEDDRNLYSCPTQPRHMSVAIDKFNYKLPYGSIFGGISAMTVSQILRFNGFSNDYWGWGGEDDDLSTRVHMVGYKIARYPESIARYKMIKHAHEKSNPVNQCRYKLMKKTRERWKHDGLSSLKYEVISLDLQPLFTRIVVDLKEKESREKLRKEFHC